MRANQTYEQSLVSQMEKASYELSRSIEYLEKAKQRLVPLVEAKTSDNHELYVKAAEWIDAITKCHTELGLTK